MERLCRGLDHRDENADSRQVEKDLRLKATQNRQAGFSLVEMMIVMVIMTIIIGGVMQVLLSGLHTYNVGSNLVDIQNQARRVVDRIAKEIQGAGIDTISPTPPATGSTGTHTITFQPCTGYSGGAVTWGSVTTIAFAYAEGETDDGLDNNNNIIADDGKVTLAVTGLDTVVLGRWIKEDGLSFNLDGSLLTITVELEIPSARGETEETTLVTTVEIKN